MSLPLLLGIAAGIIVVLVVGAVLIALAVRSSRPQVPPHPEGYVPAPPTTAMRAVPPMTAPPAAPLSPVAAAEIDRLLAAQQKIAAIKVYRDATGVGLKQAKDQIERWIPEPAFPDQWNPEGASRRTASAPSESLSAEIDRLVAAGQKITAIKLVREHRALGLAEAKAVIDAWMPGQSRI